VNRIIIALSTGTLAGMGEKHRNGPIGGSAFCTGR